MRKIIPGQSLLVLLGALFVSGCAVPVPIQLASWAIDGISYLATDKTIADHGISLVTNQDCALLRGLQGKDICDSYDETGTVAVAALAAPTDSPEFSEPQNAAKDVEIIEENSEISAFETASGGATGPADPAPIAKDSGNIVAMEIPPTAALPVPALEISPETAPVVTVAVIESEAAADVPQALLAIDALPSATPSAEPVRVASLVPADPEPAIPENTVSDVTTAMGERVLIPGRRVWSDKPEANIYYVIGSFQNRGYAKRLVKQHGDLGPSVMASRVNGVEIYRVAVGPFTRVEQRSVEWTIKKTGIRDSWAISIDRSQWMIAGPTAPKKVPVASEKPPVAETASLPDNLIQKIHKSPQYIENKQIISQIEAANDPLLDVGMEAGQTSLNVVAEPGQHGGHRPEMPAHKLPESVSVAALSSDQIGRAVYLA